MAVAKEDGATSQDDATDDIMDRLVKSVTQNRSDRASSPKTRKRSRVNRKSREYETGPDAEVKLVNAETSESEPLGSVNVTGLLRLLVTSAPRVHCCKRGL